MRGVGKGETSSGRIFPVAGVGGVCVSTGDVAGVCGGGFGATACTYGARENLGGLSWATGEDSGVQEGAVDFMDYAVAGVGGGYLASLARADDGDGTGVTG